MNPDPIKTAMSLLGRIKSQAKAASSRANGRKGGRPRKPDSAKPSRAKSVWTPVTTWDALCGQECVNQYGEHKVFKTQQKPTTEQKENKP